MKKSYTTFIVLVLFSCINVLSAQDVKEQVRQLFAEETTLKWVEHYKGRVNDINDVAMTIGFDGVQCKGYFWYLRSKDKLRLEGTIKDTVLNLVEYNKDGVQTGSITGTIKDFDGIVANWQNYDKTISESITMITASSEPRYPGYCGDNKWIRQYTGNFGEELVDILLVRSNNGSLKGTVYSPTKKITHLVEGEYTKKGRSVVLEIRDLNWDKKGTLNGKIDFQTDAIKGQYTTKEDTTNCDFTITQQLAVGCIEYADFLTKTEVTYPKARNQNFNDLMRERIQDWLTSSRAYTKQFAEKMAQLAPSQRASLRSYCWYDVDYISEQIISGIATQTNTWDSQYQSFTFNFDLENNVEISMESLFKVDTGYKEAIRAYILNELKTRPYYEDPDYVTWIQAVEFPYFTIRRDGLTFRSIFNSTYNEQQVTIPFEWLKPYLKENSVLSDLMKME